MGFKEEVPNRNILSFEVLHRTVSRCLVLVLGELDKLFIIHASTVVSFCYKNAV